MRPACCHSRRLSESRMRENLTYGLMRGRRKRAVGLLDRDTHPKGEKRPGVAGPATVPRRCPTLRLRNLRSKAPESRWPEIALRARGCYEAASPALAMVLRDDFVQTYERELPAVVQCFRDDFDACIAHLRFPLRHRRVIRTTNLLERLFLEERRRTKIIPHALGSGRCSPQLPRVVPLGDDSVEFGPVDLGHD